MTFSILLLDDDDLFRKLVVPGLFGKGLKVVEAANGKEAQEACANNRFDLLIIDGVLPDTEGIKWITRYRAAGGTIPIIFISAHWQTADIYNVLTRDLAVTQIIHKPVIPTVFAEQVYSELTRPHWAPSGRLEAAGDVSLALSLQELKREYLEDLPDELARIAELLRQAKEESSSPIETLRKVKLSAHKLRGTAGTFGMQDFGDCMGRIEDNIRRLETKIDEAPAKPDESFWSTFEQNLAGSLALAEAQQQQLLAKRQLSSRQQKQMQGRVISRILVIDEDKHFLESVEKAARQRMIEVLGASSTEEAIHLISTESIDAVLVDVRMAGHKSFELARRIRDITGEQMPIAFTSNDSKLEDRLLAAHMGASLYLSKPLDPDTLEDAIQRLMILGSRERPRVLVVDDDLHFCHRASTVLFARGMEVQTLVDPSEILDKMQSFNPDVLILDALMPYISGFDICKMLRTIPRWQELPVIFVSAQAGLDNRLAAFACGADDYLAKPMADEELVTRVSLRVERARLLKERVERDPVSGLLLRRSFMERFNIALATAKRSFQTITLVIFDLDQFKSINDHHGHLAGDAVLAGLGRLMQKRFRVEDLRGRWGGDEFILALVGSDKEHSVRLMTSFLEEYSRVDFTAEDGNTFHSSLSAGLAEFPTEGDQTYELLRVADQRLYQAKAEGRNRVVAGSKATAQQESIKEGSETRA